MSDDEKEKPKENISALTNLQTELGADTEARDDEAGPGPGEESGGEDDEISPEDLADAVLTYGNQMCIDAGLSEINAIQKLLLRMSIVGSAKKYNIESFSIAKFPELGLILATSWIGIDKVRELKAKRAAAAATAKESAAKEEKKPAP